MKMYLRTKIMKVYEEATAAVKKLFAAQIQDLTDFNIK